MSCRLARCQGGVALALQAAAVHLQAGSQRRLGLLPLHARASSLHSPHITGETNAMSSACPGARAFVMARDAAVARM
jgi:hypothetical protein